MIALDAMGGDYAPSVAVQGAVKAAHKGISITLYGNALLLYDILPKIDAQWSKLPLTVVDCKEIIEMAEEPTRAVLKKHDASMVKAIEAVAAGQADAIVTAGNSGAALAASFIRIERVPGVLRPALATFLPAKKSDFLCLDIGANVDCKPEYLVQFAYMGSIYMQQVRGIAKPRVGLLSNGHEPYKGSNSVKKAFKSLIACNDVAFVGNIEPRDIFDDALDVLVCDGFVGNVMLKTMQGMSGMLSAWLKQEQQRSWRVATGFAIAKKAFEYIKMRSDYTKTGGALLLGVKKPVIVAHGSSNAVAIEHALLMAHQVVKSRQYGHINAAIEQALKKEALTSEYVGLADEKEMSQAAQ